MSSSSFATMGRAPEHKHTRDDGSHGNGGDANATIASATNNVTEQFRFMHVSGNCDRAQVENLARNFMSTLGITNPDDERYAEQLAALTKQVSLMMKSPGSSSSSSSSSSKDGPRASGASDGGLPARQQPQPQPQQKPSRSSNTTGTSPKSKSTGDKDRGRSPRRHRSRSRTPLGRMVEGIRSRSPFRRNKDRTRSPKRQQQPTRESSDEKMASEVDDEEFFDTRMDSFTVNSPGPQQPATNVAAKNENESNTHGTASAAAAPPPPQPPPAPTNITDRPPLASVHVPEAVSNQGNSPMKSRQGQSTFKFDKEHDKFSMGSSPLKKKNNKFGSPGKKAKSPPTNRSKSKTPSPSLQRENQFDLSPLSDMGSTSGTTPLHPSIRPQPIDATNHDAHNTENAAPFFSPVPEFHAPHAFVGNSGTRRIPTPQNIMQNNPSPDFQTRRQSAPPGMVASDANTAAAAAAFGKGVSIDPKTPFDRASSSSADIPNTAPDTAETCIKKKTRNTATPPVADATSGATQQPFFTVNLGSSGNSNNNNNNNNQSKGRGRRGNTLRKGFKKGAKTAGRTTNVGFGLDEIKEDGNDETAPISTESPSNGSAVSMDTSPMFSPPPEHQASAPSAAAAAAAAGVSQGLGNPAQFHIGVGGLNARTRSKRKDNIGRRAQFHRSHSEFLVQGPSRSSFDPNHHLSRHRIEIMELKDEGKKHYLENRFKESTRFYSRAIQKYKIDVFAHVPAKDLLAVLLWNRAAALLMIGAYESAADDARIGIHYVTDPRNTHPALSSPDANPVLRPKLYCRLGRSYLKLGKVDEADRAFSEAIQSATAIQDYFARQNEVGMHDDLEKVKTEATLERTEVSRLSILLQEIETAMKLRRTMDALRAINKALFTAHGSKDLHLQKVQMLAESNRWREVASHCERLAASNTKFDGCLTEDLSKYNPFPGVPVAKHLHENYFGDTREDELKGAEMKLSNSAAPEAILRLPMEMMPYYLRSLRLEERYQNAEKCISKLEAYMAERAVTVGNSIYEKFSWLHEERNKQLETKTNRDFADNLFTNAQYEEAANIYAACLRIDSGDSGSAGGRLHAILHCNRAACFMALKRHREAMNECTAALRIYPRYLKAILRRARCYSRLEQTRQAEDDFGQWLKIMRQAKKHGNSAFLGANVFHGPDTVTKKEVQEVEAELEDLLKAKAREEEAKAREEQARNAYKERSRQWNSERFDFNSDGNSSAHRRRENWYNSSSRRWDSFKDQQSKPKAKPKPKNTTKNQNRSYGRSPKDQKNFYGILDLTHRASEEEIRKAYKKKALKCHPDKNPNDPKAAENFRRVKEAYETLNDPKLRREYDAGRY